jgi:hypothetical protein
MNFNPIQTGPRKLQPFSILQVQDTNDFVAIASSHQIGSDTDLAMKAFDGHAWVTLAEEDQWENVNGDSASMALCSGCCICEVDLEKFGWACCSRSGALEGSEVVGQIIPCDSDFIGREDVDEIR